MDPHIETDAARLIPLVSSQVGQELQLQTDQIDLLNHLDNPLVRNVVQTSVDKIDTFIKQGDQSPNRTINRQNMGIALRRISQLDQEILATITTPRQLIEALNRQDNSTPFINEGDEIIITDSHQVANRQTTARIATVEEILTRDQYLDEIGNPDIGDERFDQISKMVVGNNFIDNPVNQPLQEKTATDHPGKKVLHGQTVLPGLVYLLEYASTIEISY